MYCMMTKVFHQKVGHGGNVIATNPVGTFNGMKSQYIAYLPLEPSEKFHLPTGKKHTKRQVVTIIAKPK